MAKEKKKSFHRRFKSSLMLLLCAAALFSIFPKTEVQAAHISDEVVRVGWYTSELFAAGSSDEEKKSGYCYDYLQKVADYTSWRYVYVYGNWAELMTMLENGKIDMMGGVSAIPERKKTLLFPDSAMGTDKYYLCKGTGNKTITSIDLRTIDGKKVGLLRDNRMSYYALNWAEENSIELEEVYFDSEEEIDEALDKGTIDLKVRMVDSEIYSDKIAAVAYLGEEPIYMAVNKNRRDLLNTLQKAHAQMVSVDPYVLQNLQYKNYGATYLGRALTDEETEWLKTNPEIKVGYLKNYLPYSAEKGDGTATGLITDVTEAAFDSLAINSKPEINYLAYNSYEDMVRALKAGKIDIIFPVANDLWQLEQEDINASIEVVSDTGTLFYRKKEVQNDIHSIAVNRNNELQIEYSKTKYPDAEILYYEDIDACLDAVLYDQADGTVMDTLRIQYVTGKSRYDSLSYVQLSDGAGKCYGVATGNAVLLSILNKAVGVLGTAYGLDCSYKYIDSFYSYSFGDFIRDHFVVIAVITVILVAIILVAMFESLKKKELELLEKEKLKKEAEAASAAKSIFLFNMSHDIRTPMNAVLGFVTLMEKEVDNPARVMDYLGKMRISGEYLLNLINNVLEVARIDSGKENLNIDFVDLLDEKYSVILENDITKKNLDFEKDLRIEHRYVYADAYKIREIMLNLLSNAVKYTPEGGRVGLRLREYPGKKSGQATYVAQVYDTGIGMTEEFQKHIFELFTREFNSTESRVQGTGLGMSIVKKLVDLMDGTVTVESQPDKGSTFTVTVSFPIVKNPELVLEEPFVIKKEDIDLTGKHILVAEDNELNAEIDRAILEDVGIIVDVAVNGSQCVDFVSNHEADHYDLILMDIQMPIMNGYEATKVIRNMEDGKKASIPIIAMTANAFDEDRKEALASGMNGHLAKPVDVSKLMETLQNYLG